jgi:hypothetical protein
MLDPVNRLRAELPAQHAEARQRAAKQDEGRAAIGDVARCIGAQFRVVNCQRGELVVADPAVTVAANPGDCVSRARERPTVDEGVGRIQRFDGAFLCGPGAEPPGDGKNLYKPKLISPKLSENLTKSQCGALMNACRTGNC